MENIYTSTNTTFTTANGVTVSYQEIFESVRKSIEIYGKTKGRALSAEELEDLFQDSIFKALKYCKGFDPTKARAGTWAGKIACNTQIDAFREHNKHLARFVRHEATDEDGEPKGSFFDEVSDGYSADREVEGNEAVERIMNAIGSLSENYRFIISLQMEGDEAEENGGAYRLHCRCSCNSSLQSSQGSQEDVGHAFPCRIRDCRLRFSRLKPSEFNESGGFFRKSV